MGGRGDLEAIKRTQPVAGENETISNIQGLTNPCIVIEPYPIHRVRSMQAVPVGVPGGFFRRSDSDFQPRTFRSLRPCSA